MAAYWEWLVELEDGLHALGVEIGDGKVITSFDWKERKNIAFRLVPPELPYNEDILGHRFTIKIISRYNDPRPIPTVDGREAYSITGFFPLVQATNTTSRRKKSFHEIIEEQATRERNLVVGTQDFPLDNRFGTDVIVVEHQLSKTVSNEIAISVEAGLEAQLGANVIKLIKGQIIARLQATVGQTIGEKVTMSKKLIFSVKPGTAVLYTVKWTRKDRSGSYIVLYENKEYRLPYQMFYDLGYKILSREIT